MFCEIWGSIYHSQDFYNSFYFVQIAPYKYGEDHFGGAEIRNAQRIVSKNVDKTEMVVTSDISTIDDIHPKDKKTVGVRLANLALKKKQESKIVCIKDFTFLLYANWRFFTCTVLNIMKVQILLTYCKGEPTLSDFVA